MRPSDLFQEMADIVQRTCKKVYRDEPCTAQELDAISDRVMLLCAEERDRIAAEAEVIDRAEQELDKRKEGL